MSIDTNLISWALTVVAALTAVYFNFRSSKRDDATERRGYDSGVVADLRSLLQEYRTQLASVTLERDASALQIVDLKEEVKKLELRIRDMRLEVLELNQAIIVTARENALRKSGV